MPRGHETPAATSSPATTGAPSTAAASPAVPAPPAAPAATASAPVTADTTAAPATAPAVPVSAPTQSSRGTGHATEATRTDQGDPILQAVTAPRGGEPAVTVPTPPTAPTAGPAPTAGAPAPAAPLAQQLARPVFALAHAGTGEHVVTVQVVPDTLGPVTVRAHVTAHGMHVELFAASEAGRDAVRQVLPDLRRDAAGAGVATTLDLSSQNHPGAQPGRDDRPAPSPLRSDPGLEARPASAPQPTPRPSTVRAVGLDVLA